MARSREDIAARNAADIELVTKGCKVVDGALVVNLEFTNEGDLAERWLELVADVKWLLEEYRE